MRVIPDMKVTSVKTILMNAVEKVSVLMVVLAETNSVLMNVCVLHFIKDQTVLLMLMNVYQTTYATMETVQTPLVGFYVIVIADGPVQLVTPMLMSA